MKKMIRKMKNNKIKIKKKFQLKHLMKIKINQIEALKESKLDFINKLYNKMKKKMRKMKNNKIKIKKKL